ncbi:synaptotagmin-like protein 2 isoform X3 [Epinephelus fuscoguttatus]|uniref:synaptotagmin-like protein 2 isoform X3 n=1 Tax=Epinephelus fuscoguttatus TaxID=293821 RepID=UPI0020D14F33|nr:synaptotagmin-like protein 2 isoform X3 [Epinephelus fuscoguttatus]
MEPVGGFSTLASFHTVLLRETGGEGGTTMIDLSYLTEEEQGVIMAVLRRDAELKKAEEERIRKLEKLLDGTPQSDPGLKYLTGEWFYEAKSRRHMDKIHGSEIIWASMKQRRPGLDASPRSERSNTPSIQGSDIVPPPKPARCFDELQPQRINGVEQENVSTAVRSPRTPRQNPFNRASLILVEPPENDDDMPATQVQESSETEPISPLRNHTAEAGQTSGGSLTSEGSSVGFRPVPKKRTFLTRCTPSQPEINYLVLESQGGSVGIVPAPRRSLQRGSSESSNQSFIKGQDEMPQESVSIQSQSAQPSKPLDENLQQALCDVSQVSPYSSLERERHSPSITRDRLATFTKSEAPTDTEIPKESDERDEWTQREYEALNAVVLHTASIQDSDRGNSSSVEKVMMQEELSLPQSTVGENEIVRKALRRAEARPKSVAKSVEDITADLPREEEGQNPADDLRRISNVSSIPSHSSYLYSDPEHLKKMSKSVPSFLQDEDVERDNDFPCEDVDFPRRLTTCSSLKNLTGSSGMSSLSSLSGSVMTMYSGDFGNVEVQGYIQFSINYILKLREFHIFVAECQDLAAVDPKRGRSDPYVKSYLSPDKANLGKRKTSVKKKTLNPKFNEILRYRVRMEYLRTQTLILSVWHHDTFGRNSFLGEVDLDLSKWDFDHTQMNYLALKARTAPTLSPSLGRGEIRLALRFLPHIIRSEGLAKGAPNTGEVHIWVKECKNLPLIRPTIDPYVKCFVLPDTSRKSRQKTRVMRRTVDPAFNHTMVYDGIRQADLLEACVELTVWDRDRLASNLLGGLRIGAGTGKSYGASVDWMDSTPHEVALWERMMATPNQWVEDILPLRVLNSSKTSFK